MLEYLNSKLSILNNYESKSFLTKTKIYEDKKKKEKIDKFLKLYNANSISVFPSLIKDVFEIINLDYTNLFEQSIKLKMLICNDNKLSLQLNKNQKEMVSIFETKLDIFLKNLNNDIENNIIKLQEYNNEDNKNNNNILKIKSLINNYENKIDIFNTDFVNEIYYDQTINNNDRERLLIEILNFNNEIMNN